MAVTDEKKPYNLAFASIEDILIHSRQTRRSGLTNDTWEVEIVSAASVSDSVPLEAMRTDSASRLTRRQRSQSTSSQDLLITQSLVVRDRAFASNKTKLKKLASRS